MASDVLLETEDLVKAFGTFRALDGLTLQVHAGEMVGLVGPDGAAHWLRPRPGAFDGVRPLDGAWLEHALSDLPHSVTYQHGIDHVVDTVAAGAAAAAVLIRPVSVAEIERTAREGALMPPKSTFFTPKLRTGLVVRSLV